MQLLRSETGRVTISAHRGASGYAPENTLAALQLAHELGADMVEFDVHLTADDRLVVLHDDTLDRTTDGRGYVRDHAWADIARLDAGAWYGPEFAGQRVPLLDQALEWATGVGMAVSIEMKRPNEALGRAAYPDLPARILETVCAHGLEDRVVLFSDDHSLVRAARQLAPTIGTSMVLGLATFIDPVALARQAGADGLAVYWRYASRRMVDACHAAGLHVFGFGVGDDLIRTREIGAMLANGTDLVSSGQPDRLRAFVDAWTSDSGSGGN
jgi:glycerophosphoryl diester phosphodiesterase